LKRRWVGGRERGEEGRETDRKNDDDDDEGGGGRGERNIKYHENSSLNCHVWISSGTSTYSKCLRKEFRKSFN
jgi:ABC-type Zn2+ transport system substrate-binding protein/surface adhesin